MEKRYLPWDCNGVVSELIRLQPSDRSNVGSAAGAIWLTTTDGCLNYNLVIVVRPVQQLGLYGRLPQMNVPRLQPKYDDKLHVRDVHC